MFQKPAPIGNSNINYNDLINANFDDNQANYALKKIKELEATHDILQLIKFQQLMFGQIKQKTERKSSAEVKIIKQLISNYDFAIRKYPQDFNLHMQYFNFYKCTQTVEATNKIVSILTKNFANTPEMWINLSKWQETDCKDFTEAGHFLKKGLILNKTNHSIYSSGIKLELAKVKMQMQKKSKECDVNDTPCSTEINLYIEAMLKYVQDFDFHLEILKLLEPHKYTSKEQQKIIENFLKHHINEPRMWEALALREFNGLHYEPKDDVRSNIQYRINQCVKVFKDGLTKISNENKPKLWRLYLDCVTDFQSDLSVAHETKIAVLIEALGNANNEMNILTESDYLTWIKYIEDDKQLTNILQKGTDALPQSVELWKIRLKRSLKKKRSNIIEIFNKGVEVLKKDALPLWYIMIRYHTLTSDLSTLKDCYEKALAQPNEIASIFKPLYIRWLACNYNIRKAREVYNGLFDKKPFCREMHEQMIKLEEVQINMDYEIFEKTYDNYCNQFGEEDTAVWIAYDLFWLKQNNLEKCEQVAQKALRTLNPLLLSVFQERHDQIVQQIKDKKVTQLDI